MQVSKEDVIHIAKLASLNISDNEIDNYRDNLQDILEFVNTLNSVNTDGIDETIGATENYNVFRKDEIKQSTTRDELLKNAPSQDEGMFRIPKVIN